jgi:hypothetical protein
MQAPNILTASTFFLPSSVKAFLLLRFVWGSAFESKTDRRHFGGPRDFFKALELVVDDDSGLSACAGRGNLAGLFRGRLDRCSGILELLFLSACCWFHGVTFPASCNNGIGTDVARVASSKF